MKKYISNRHIIQNRAIVKPGNEIELDQETASRLLGKGYVTEIKDDGQGGQEEVELDIADIDDMTHGQLDALAIQVGIPGEEYPKSENKDGKIDFILQFAEENGLVE